MSRTIIDLGAGQPRDIFSLSVDGAHTCFLPAPFGLRCDACARRKQRLAELQEGSPFTRPMREAREPLELALARRAQPFGWDPGTDTP